MRGENEPLSGGGKSSGLMSWLKIGDRAAGAIKSGGTTRRAAKMVCLDLDHPDIERFVSWKVREELKVSALVEGMKALPDEHKALAKRLGLTLDYDFNGEAYQTVSGQNANNSVRVPDEFFEALEEGKEWKLFNRVDGEVAKTVSSKDLWEQICFAAWRCADPGLQYDSTINAWHTCPESGRINASNPCSEYMFLDNTACNLASLNLMKFYDSKARAFDVEKYEHAIDLWTIVLEISVLMAAFPSEEIARLSWEYRTLGLGYANIGAMLMQAGIAYDSDEGRAVCAMLTAILTGRSYRQSALMAAEQGPFAGYRRNANHMLRVIRNHRRAARGVARETGGREGYEDLKIRPVPIDHAIVKAGRVNIVNAKDLLGRSVQAWDDALELGEQHGYRNAQVSVIAPTGTIGLLMDCDTTGVEPDFALVKFKKLAGGGYFKIANASLRPALEALGYSDKEVRSILTYVLGTLSLEAPMPEENGHVPEHSKQTLGEFLRGKGLTDDDLKRITDALPGVFELSFALGAWTLGDEALTRLGIDADAAKADPAFNLLVRLGLTRKQIDALNEVICGAQTIEGAPHLKDEHLAVFDCASRCGRKGRRFIAVNGHIRMMAAAQPFISGAISKTINLPAEATVEDISDAYRLSWDLGLKANALYRDGCKLSQPLSSKSDSSSDDESESTDSGDGGVADAELRVLMAEEDEDAVEAAHDEVAAGVASLARAAAAEDEDAVAEERVRVIHRPMRRRLPDTRRSFTHKFCVAGHEGYLTVGLYEDGTPGELFITMAKEGSTIGG
ncbi:MAG: adenosylcobalamin-dependent ribonucleoside-diphosphate reductase, partial [Planctomycetota bacterium]|nr:adenosylcobalamin-dependent ribonucleoside-diphosphate reductase [Planctomycetota bacterium]